MWVAECQGLPAYLSIYPPYQIRLHKAKLYQNNLDPVSKIPEFKVCACKIEKTGRKKGEHSKEFANQSRDIQY